MKNGKSDRIAAILGPHHDAVFGFDLRGEGTSFSVCAVPVVNPSPSLYHSARGESANQSFGWYLR